MSSDSQTGLAVGSGTIAAPLRGVVPPILTPMRDGRPDLASLKVLLARTADAGCSALCLGGTVSLGPQLTESDWISVMETAAAWGRGRVPLVAGVMETSTPRAIERIRRIAALGYRGCMLSPTTYVALRTVAEFMRHFSDCRAASDLELMLYNVPTCTGSPIPEEVVEACFRDGICRGIKDSSGNLEGFVRICAIANRHGGAALMGGRPDLAWLRKIGAGGMVPVPANLDPAPFVAGWKAIERGDTAEMERQQPAIDALWSLLVTPDDWMRGTIYAIGRQGLGDGTLVPPLEMLAPSRRAAVEAYVDSHR